MPVLLDEAGTALLDEGLVQIYDETGTPANLTPAWAAGGGAFLDITTMLAPPDAPALLFGNTGTEHLLVTASGGGVTVTVTIGAMVLGQPVNPFPPVTLSAGHLYVFGPFHTLLDQPGGSLVQVMLSSTTGVQVAAVQWGSFY